MSHRARRSASGRRVRARVTAQIHRARRRSPTRACGSGAFFQDKFQQRSRRGNRPPGRERHLQSPIRPFQSRPISNLPVPGRPIFQFSRLVFARASLRRRQNRSEGVARGSWASLPAGYGRPRTAPWTSRRHLWQIKNWKIVCKSLIGFNSGSPRRRKDKTSGGYSSCIRTAATR